MITSIAYLYVFVFDIKQSQLIDVNTKQHRMEGIYMFIILYMYIMHMYPSFIAVITNSYEFGCVWIKSRRRGTVLEQNQDTVIISFELTQLTLL